MSMSNAKTYPYYKLGNIFTELYFIAFIFGSSFSWGNIYCIQTQLHICWSGLHKGVGGLRMIPQLFFSSMRKSKSKLNRSGLPGLTIAVIFSSTELLFYQMEADAVPRKTRRQHCVCVLECWHQKGNTQLENHHFIMESALPIPSEL